MGAQVWGQEFDAGLVVFLEPRGVPSSKYARRYHAPSHAWASIVLANCAARKRQARASAPNSRRVSNSAKFFSTKISNQASQTLSLLPPSPTRLRPSFQSPPPISGSPCGPEVAERATARRQCSSREPSFGEATGIERLSVCCSSNGCPSRNGII